MTADFVINEISLLLRQRNSWVSNDKMLGVCFLFWAWTAEFAAQEAWVNQHPELESIITSGVKESINVFDKSLKDIIDLPDFHYYHNISEKSHRQFDSWIGELRKLKSIVRVNGTNVTKISPDRRILSFFVQLNLMEITYHRYNQTNYDFCKVGKLIIRPETNLIQINCSAVHETEPGVESWAHAGNTTLVSFVNPLLRVISTETQPKYTWIPEDSVNELIPPLLYRIRPVLESNIRQGVDAGLQRRGLSHFYRNFFSKNDTHGEKYKI